MKKNLTELKNRITEIKNITRRDNGLDDMEEQISSLENNSRNHSS